MDLAVRHDAVAQRDEHHEEDAFARMSADEVRQAWAAELAAMVRSGELSVDQVASQLATTVVDAEVVD